jgi:hypothetical protein
MLMRDSDRRLQEKGEQGERETGAHDRAAAAGVLLHRFTCWPATPHGVVLLNNLRNCNVLNVTAKGGESEARRRYRCARKR